MIKASPERFTLKRLQTLEFSYFSPGSLQSCVQHQTDAAVKAQQGTDPVADKGQRKSCVGKDPGRHCDVRESLKCDQNSHSGADHFSLQVRRLSGQVQALVDDDSIQQQDHDAADEAQLFPDHGKNEIRLRL